MTELTSDVQGVLVQEIPGARIVQHFDGDQDVELAKGSLRVLMVSIALHDPFSDGDSKSSEKKALQQTDAETDIWLALEVGSDFSLPIKASQKVIADRQTSSYVFPSSDVPGASVRLTLESSDRKALDEFEELLYDYCVFPDTKGKGQGSIEFLDDNGHLLGTIDGPWQLKEDPTLHAPGHEKDPVILELPDGNERVSSQQVDVTAAPRNEKGQLPEAYQNDWLLRGAHLVSRTLEKGSTWAGSRMLRAADSYVARTTPPGSHRSSFDTSNESRSSEKTGHEASLAAPVTNTSTSANVPVTTSGRTAVTFSPQTHSAARSVRNVSGKVCSISNRTTNAILGAASNVGDQIGKKTGIQARPNPDGTTQAPKGVRGALNRSLIAFNVVLDGVTTSAERLLKDGGEASGRMIEHRYGSEAKVISGNVASVGRSAFVVYKDINGVRRKALLKVATGTIKARAPDGGEVVLQQESSSINEGVGSTSSAANHPPSYDSTAKATTSTSAVEKCAIPQTPTHRLTRSGDIQTLHARTASCTDARHRAPFDEYNWPATPEQYKRRDDWPVVVPFDSPSMTFKREGMDEYALQSESAADVDHDECTSYDFTQSRELGPISFGLAEAAESTHAPRCPSPSSMMMRQACHQRASRLIVPTEEHAAWLSSFPQLSFSHDLAADRTAAEEWKSLARTEELNGIAIGAVQDTPKRSKAAEDVFLRLCLFSSFSSIAEERGDVAIKPASGYQDVNAQPDLRSDQVDVRKTTEFRSCPTYNGAFNSLSFRTWSSPNLPPHAHWLQRRSTQHSLTHPADHKTSSASSRNEESAAAGGVTLPLHESANVLDFAECAQVSSKPFTNGPSALAVDDEIDFFALSSSFPPLEPFSTVCHATGVPTKQYDGGLEASALLYALARGGESTGIAVDSFDGIHSHPRISTPKRECMDKVLNTVTPRRLTTLRSPYMRPANIPKPLLPGFTSTPLPHFRCCSSNFTLDSEVSSESSDDASSDSDSALSSPPTSPCSSIRCKLDCDGDRRSTCHSTSFASKLKLDQPVSTYSRPSISFTRSSGQSDSSQSPQSPFDNGDRPILHKHGDVGFTQQSHKQSAKKRRIVPRLNAAETLTYAHTKSKGKSKKRKWQQVESGSFVKHGKASKVCTSTLYSNDHTNRNVSPSSAGIGDQGKEDEDAACTLLSLGYSSARVDTAKAVSSDRTRRAVRRTQSAQSSVQSLPKKRQSTKQCKEGRSLKVVKVHGDRMIVFEENAKASENPAVSYSTRPFSPNLPRMPERFPLWYRRYPVPSPLQPSTRAKVFGITHTDQMQELNDESLQQTFLRSQREFGIWKEPEHLLDLYAPRWMRSVGREKEAMCPICYEEGHVRFLKTKTSQYNYHLINQHGISPLTRRPYEPPVAFRSVSVTNPCKHDRKIMLQGQCQVCSRFVDLESVRDGEVNVPEIYWWKHASQCHKRTQEPVFSAEGVFVEDEFFHRLTRYIRTVPKEEEVEGSR